LFRSNKTNHTIESENSKTIIDMRTSLLICLLALIFFFPFKTLQAQNEIFLRKIEFELTKISKNAEDNEFFLTLQFNKGTNYKFNILNQVNGKGGDAIVELHDGEKLVGTNSAGDKYYGSFLFQCNKTGFYDVVIKFKTQLFGSSIIDLSMLK
jgi:hypothetical protein